MELNRFSRNSNRCAMTRQITNNYRARANHSRVTDRQPLDDLGSGADFTQLPNVHVSRYVTTGVNNNKRVEDRVMPHSGIQIDYGKD